MQKKIATMIAMIGFMMGAVAMADLPAAQIKHDETVTTHYGDPNHPVQMTQSHWHHTAEVGAVQVITLKDHEAYAVNPKTPAINWLNEHTRGDVLEHGAPVYNHKGEHLHLSFLYPGFYHLTYFKLEEAAKDPGYQDFKKMFGDRVELVPPKGPGYYVVIHILPPKIAKKVKSTLPQKDYTPSE